MCQVGLIMGSDRAIPLAEDEESPEADDGLEDITTVYTGSYDPKKKRKRVG